LSVFTFSRVLGRVVDAALAALLFLFLSEDYRHEREFLDLPHHFLSDY